MVKYSYSFGAAGDLVVGDKVYNFDGTTSVVVGSKVEKFDDSVLVYNLEVEDLHSYFVGDMQILVHNYSTNKPVTADDIKFSDKFSKPGYDNQVAERGWSNQKIADAINHHVKTASSVNKYIGNEVTLYYVDEVHYVAVDNVTNKVIQVADLISLTGKWI